MADPLSIAVGVLAVIGKSISAIQTIRSYASKYTDADIDIAALVNECTAIRLALSQIQRVERHTSNAVSAEIREDYNNVLESCVTIFSVLFNRLNSFNLESRNGDNKASAGAKLKYAWNEQKIDTLRSHLRGLPIALNLLLTAFQSNTIFQTHEILRSRQSKQVLKSISDSAQSLRSSQSESTIGISDRDTSEINSLIGDEEFEFDDELVGTKAYRRVLTRHLPKGSRGLSRTERPAPTSAYIENPPDTDDLSWSQLRKALEEVGITPTMLAQNRDLITTIFHKGTRESVNEGNISQYINRRDNVGDSDTNQKRARDLTSSSLLDKNATASLASNPFSTSAEQIDGYESDNTQRNGGSPTSVYIPVRMNKVSHWTLLGAKHAARGLSTPVTTLPERDGHTVNLTPTQNKEPVAILPHSEVVKSVNLLETKRDAKSKGKEVGVKLKSISKSGKPTTQPLVIDSGIDLRTRVSDWGYALYEAAREGQLEQVQLLLGQGKDAKIYRPSRKNATDNVAWRQSDNRRISSAKTGAIDVEKNEMCNAFDAAIASGHEKVVQLLLEKEANIEAPRANGWTALHNAARFGNEEIIQLLLERGADVKAETNLGFTALYISSINGNERICQLLLQSGADIEAKDRFGRTALHAASRQGSRNVVKLLVDNGADVNTKMDYGLTALHLVSARGSNIHLWKLEGSEDGAEGQWKILQQTVSREHEEIMQLLTDNEADIEAKAKNGGMALHYAAAYGYEKGAQLLVKNGADIEAKDDRLITALHYAASQGHENVVMFLVKNGADIEAKDDILFTALHIAAIEGHENIVKFLVKNRADIEAKDDRLSTALHIAASQGHENVVIFLVKNGADIEAKDGRLCTALHNAAGEGYENVVVFLVKNGADIEAKNSRSFTSLHYAAIKGHEKVVEFLVENGADIEARGFAGSTALQLAELKGHTNVVKLLKK